MLPMKKQHQVNSSAANPHNSFLDADEVQQLINKQLNTNICTNILEWYIRTLSDEIYKLRFLDKYKRIKIFWPSQYSNYLTGSNHNGENIISFLNQFQLFDIEDYFDVIIMCHLDQTLTLKIYLNSFTYPVQENERSHFSDFPGLELFIERNLSIQIKNDIVLLADLTNAVLLYVGPLQLSKQQITERIVPILKEETTVLLYELYKQ